MTSSSSLYGTPPNQDVSSTNSTSLYGGAATPIPDSSGNLVVRGDLLVLSGNILTTATTGNIFPTNATTVNIGTAGTAVSIGADTGTTTINNNLVVDGDVTAEGGTFGNVTVGVVDDNTIDNASAALTLSSGANSIVLNAEYISNPNSNAYLFNSPTTVVAFDSATSLTMGETTGTTTIRNDLVVQGTGNFSGDITTTGAYIGNITAGVATNNTITTTSGSLLLSSNTGEIGLIGADTLYTDQSSFLLLNSPTTITAFDSATGLTMGATTGTTTIRNDLNVQGNITGDGGDFGNIQVGVTNDQTIDTTTGDLLLGSFTDVIGLGTTNTIYSTSPSFLLLNAPTTITAFDSATSLTMADTTGTTTIRNDVVVGGDLKINGNNILSSTGATAITLSGNDVTIADDLTINGNNVNLAQSTLFGYSENNDRANRPEVQSTTGNSSGFRVLAPNATTSANSNLTVFATNDINNGKFMSVQASGSTTAPFGIRTGEYTGGVLGASGDVISISDGTTPYATINPAGPTNNSDLTTKSYVDGLIPTINTYDTNVVSVTGGAELDLRSYDGFSYSIVGSTKFLGGTNITVSETAPNEITIDGTDLNTTYTIDATSTTGGANFNLTGSDASVDSVAFKGSGATTVTRTDANTITISSTDNNTTYTQDVSSTTGGANLNLVGSDSTTDSVKFAGGTNVTVVATDASTMTINATDTNTTYDFNATSTTGGANLNLVGSDSTTDTVKLTSGTGVTVAQVSGTEVSVAIGQPVATTDNVEFASVRTPTINANGGVSFVNTGVGGGTYATVNQFGPANSTDLITKSYLDLNAVTSLAAGTGISVSGSTGAVTVSNTGVTSLAAGTYLSVNASTGSVTVSTNATSANTASTIVARDANGDFSAGTITANLANGDRVLGSLTATTSKTYTFPAPPLATITDNNGIDAVSSYNNSSTTLGNGAQGQFTHYIGDTFAGGNTAAVFSLRTANGNSETVGTVPFTGLAPTSPSAVISSNVLGGLNFNGYATTGFSDYISTQNQGGGFNAVHAGQIQFAPAETFADGTLTISGGTITAVSRVSTATTVTACAGTRGQFTIPSTTIGVGVAIVVTGTLTGTATGIGAGTYYVVANNGTPATQITLSATVGGPPITTTAGTVTGLAFTRQLITVTYSAQSNIPFGLNAKVAVSGFTNVTSGTYMVVGASSTTSVTIGALSTGVPALTGSQSLSTPTVTNGGTNFRVRGFPTATPLNSGNRVDMINATTAATTFRSNSFTFNTGAYGNTGVGVTGNNINYNRVYGQWQYDATITPAASNTAYAFPIAGASGAIDFANIASVGSTSRIIPGAAGMYKLQFSVQVQNDDSAAEHTAYFWWRKNGVDVPSSMGQVGVVKATGSVNGLTIAGWDNMISSANTTDYWELMYAVDDATHVDFPYFTATAFGPATAALFITLMPVGA